MSDWLKYGWDRRRPASVLVGSLRRDPCAASELQLVLQVQCFGHRHDAVNMAGRLREMVAPLAQLEYVERADGEIAIAIASDSDSVFVELQSDSLLDRVEAGLRPIRTVRSLTTDARSEHERLIAKAAAVRARYDAGAAGDRYLPRRRVA